MVGYLQSLLPRWWTPRSAALLVLAGILLLVPGMASAQEAGEHVVLWHSYRGGEEEALTLIMDALQTEQPALDVEVLAVPYEVLASKLTTAIPRGNGPDVFVFAHERIGGWARSAIIEPLDERLDPGEREQFLAETLSPLQFEGKLYGLPLAFKNVALFYNKELVATPPKTTDELVSMAESLSGDERFGLAYQSDNFFFHAAWYFGFGAELFRADGSVDFDSQGVVDSLAFIKDLQDRKLMPEEPTGALISQLFNEGKAAMVINGPWFTGEIAEDIDFAVAPLPTVSATGKAASPFLTDEAVFISAYAKDKDAALVVARRIAGADGALTRALVGKQIVAHKAAWEDERLSSDPVLMAFRDQLSATVPMDNRPEMRNVWEPAQLALRNVLKGLSTAEESAVAAQRRLGAITRAPPPEVNPGLYALLAILLILGATAYAVNWLIGVGKRGELRVALSSWTWIAPAMTGTAILIFVPFAVGLALSFFHHSEGNWTFVGMGNFTSILGTEYFGVLEPLSFYYAFMVTIAWTVVNLVLHVSFGLGLALLLNRKGLQLKGFYRVVLILPWAVPNYITALIWKGLFHKQFGAINGMLEMLGLEGVGWFSSFGTAFFANVCANAWLGFPFMMVVCLGALQSVPTDLYEAADVDGAGRWDKLTRITLPLLRPALIPAVLLGTVWTFNQFNIVYLVSGGEPNNSTEILISEAWRWAFARQEQYGYAAAYAALIFVILLMWSLVSIRINKKVEDMT